MTPAPSRPARPKRQQRPPIKDRDVPAFNWHNLIDAYVHEVKVGLAEALDWVGQPLSARELWMMVFPGQEYGTIAYHARTLEKQGLIAEAGERTIRGATEIYYLPAS